MIFRLQPVFSLMEFVFDGEALPVRVQFRTQELCTPETLRAMYEHVQHHRREGDPAPQDVILEGIASFQPERVAEARPVLEALEKQHCEQVLAKMAGRLS